MRTQKITLSSLVFLLISFLPFHSYSQVDFSKFNVFDDEIVEDIQLTPEQVEQISNLEYECGSKRVELNDALLYHEDFKMEYDGVFEKRNDAIIKILTPEQVEAYQNKIEGDQMLRTVHTRSDLTEKYLNCLSYLDLTEGQAESIADAYMNWEAAPTQNQEVVLNKALKEILTKQQFKQYRKKKSANNSLNIPRYINNESEVIDHIKFGMEYWGEFYLPRRNNIRDQFENLIEPSDRKKIAQLRADYQEMVKERYRETPKYRKSKTNVSKEYFKLYRNARKLRAEELINTPKEVKIFLQSDRETFYFAKDLAVKYDAIIDDFELELDALKDEITKEFKSTFPTYGFSKYNNFKKPETDYPNDKKEMYFNIAFLLISADEPNSETILSQNQFIKAYPMPAQDHQTIEYELKEKGEISLDILNAEGKVIKVIFEGEADSGLHVHRIDLDDVTGRVFFYRLKTSEGISTMKTMRF